MGTLCCLCIFPVNLKLIPPKCLLKSGRKDKLGTPNEGKAVLSHQERPLLDKQKPD